MSSDDVVASMMNELPPSLNFAEEEKKVMAYWVRLTP
jgi:hypothetical protein